MSNSNPDGERLDAVDEIANLLVGEESDEVETEASSDDIQTDETEEQEAAEVNESEEPEQDEDVSWSGVLGVDDDKVVVDEEGNLVGLNVKVDGEVSTVKVADLIAGYQTTKDYTRKTQALSAERKEFEQAREQVIQDYSKRLDDVAKLSTYMQQSMLKPFEGIDWQRLRAENPAEYAATIQDYQLKQGEFQQIMQAIEQDRGTTMQQVQQQQQAQRAEQLKANADKLLSMHPEWADKEKAAVDFKKLSEFAANTYGFSDEEFAEIVDARAIGVLEDAMKFRNGQKLVEQKKAKPVPKFQKSTGKRTRTLSKLDQLTKHAKSARGAERRVAQANAISELLLNG
jgi:hypothetical protein